MLETHPGEAVKKQHFCTALMTDLAHEYEAGTLSKSPRTRPLTRPASCVTKHICEENVHAMSTESNTRCMVVRFGNVLGSSGSVVTAVSRTNPCRRSDHGDASGNEAVLYGHSRGAQLVLQAAAMGRGGEIFVLEMGEQIKIVDLARDLIRLSGLPPHAIEIVFSGVRPVRNFTKNSTSTTRNTCRRATPRSWPLIIGRSNWPMCVRPSMNFARSWMAKRNRCCKNSKRWSSSMSARIITNKLSDAPTVDLQQPAIAVGPL